MRAAMRREVASIRPFEELEEIHQADALAWIDTRRSPRRIRRASHGRFDLPDA
jgi:hypothetical protein